MVNLKFSQVIIYGPLLHQHPHSWMFLGFQKAFLYKRYKVIWVNQEKKKILDNYDLTNSLFITDEHDDDIPLRSDSFYILFKNTNSKYNNYQKLNIGIYGNDLPDYVTQWKEQSYIQYSLKHRELYFPLATELLPPEILTNQQRSVLTYPGNTNTICILGNISGDGVSKIYADLKSNCRKNNYKMFVVNNKNSEQRAKDIRTSQIVPVLSSTKQLNRNEIDYRLFQIISYGGFPVTNSEFTSNSFYPKCFYSDNGKTLLLDGIEYKKKYFTDEWKWNIMEAVKIRHTYVKRIDTIFWMLMRL